MNIKSARFGDAYLVDDGRRIVVYYSLHSQELKAESFEVAAERLMVQALRNGEIIVELPSTAVKNAMPIGFAAHGDVAQQMFIGEHFDDETKTVRAVVHFIRGSKAVVVAETKKELMSVLVAALSKLLLNP